MDNLFSKEELKKMPVNYVLFPKFFKKRGLEIPDFNKMRSLSIRKFCTSNYRKNLPTKPISKILLSLSSNDE